MATLTIGVAPPNPLVAGRYRLESLFGAPEDAEGGQGTVYRGVDTHTGQSVAIKVFMRSEHAEHEASIFEHLSANEHLIGYHAFDPTFRRGAIVMEAAEAGCFFNTAVEELPMSPERIQLFVLPVVHGLSYMHARGIAHLDIKFDNFLLTTPTTLKLADFGHAARFTGPKAAQTRHCGSDGWRAPELYSHRTGVGPGYDAFACDLWSLGVVVFSLAVGNAPFGEAGTGVVLPQLDEYSAFACAQAEGLSGGEAVCRYWGVLPKWQALQPALQELIDGTMQVNPQRRWTLEQVKVALENMTTTSMAARPHETVAAAANCGDYLAGLDQVAVVRPDPMEDDEDDEPPVWRSQGPGSATTAASADEAATSKRLPPRLVRTREGGDF